MQRDYFLYNVSASYAVIIINIMIKVCPYLIFACCHGIDINIYSLLPAVNWPMPIKDFSKFSFLVIIQGTWYISEPTYSVLKLTYGIKTATDSLDFEVEALNEHF